MAITDLHDLFVYKLRQQYYAEQELVDTMDEMTRNATNDRLSQGFANHLEETQAHVERLEDVFAALDVPLETIEDPVVEGLEEERRTLEREIDDDKMLDIVYLTAGMMTERVEMTAYEGLSMLATKLEFSDDVKLPLESNYDEEKSTYRELEALSAASEMKSLWDRLTPS